MLGMVSYSRRPQSGQITCYLNRTYHVLPTVLSDPKIASPFRRDAEVHWYEALGIGAKEHRIKRSAETFLVSLPSVIRRRAGIQMRIASSTCHRSRRGQDESPRR